MNETLKLEIIPGARLSTPQRAEILSLCHRAYEADLGPIFNTFSDATHVIARLDQGIVSHALWVTRWLQPGNLPPLRTAYVELVATEPSLQGRGFASAVMRRLADAIQDYELGGLCPAELGLYEKSGWELWQGPLFIRSADGLLATPEERAMILRLPATPPLDLDEPLSAEWREGELW